MEFACDGHANSSLCGVYKMSDEVKSGNVIVRMPMGVIEAIDSLVKKNVYGTRSDFVKSATRRYLKELDCLVPQTAVVSLPVGKGLDECKNCEIVKQYENHNKIK